MIAESAFVLVVIRLLHGVSERPAISSQSVSQFSEVSESDLVGVEEKQQFLHKVDKHETRWSNTRSSVKEAYKSIRDRLLMTLERAMLVIRLYCDMLCIVLGFIVTTIMQD